MENYTSYLYLQTNGPNVWSLNNKLLILFCLTILNFNLWKVFLPFFLNYLQIHVVNVISLGLDRIKFFAFEKKNVELYANEHTKFKNKLNRFSIFNNC